MSPFLMEENWLLEGGEGDRRTRNVAAICMLDGRSVFVRSPIGVDTLEQRKETSAGSESPHPVEG
jgi:hypothetical protein